MDKTSVNLRIAVFRHRIFVWMVLFFLSWSFLPAVSMAQQPTATMSAVSGTVLVNGQTQGTGTVLNAGDIIETQAGASVVLELSDGSLLELGENTKLDIAELSQTTTGALVSRVKMAWGWIRAKLSPGHQKEGSKFDIETPNAIVGVKFSEPDIEVSYNPDTVETVGIAHTVELIAKNLLTDEEILVPVGSTVIIVGTTVKIVAGILAIAGATETGTTGASTAAAATESTGTASTGSAATSSTTTSSAGMGTGTKVAIGLGAIAAAGAGVAAVMASSEGSGESEGCTTAECTGDLSGSWFLTGSCTGQGCTPDVLCPSPGTCCGLDFCNCCKPSHTYQVIQAGNMISGSSEVNGTIFLINGTVDGNVVSFTTDASVTIPIRQTDGNTSYTGIVSGNTIQGTLQGSGDVFVTGWDMIPITWSGEFTVTIRK